MIEPTDEMVNLAVDKFLKHPELNNIGEIDTAMRETLVAVLAIVERDQAAQRKQLSEALEAVARAIATDSRDWGLGRGDAWLWGVLVGWDCEEVHDHEYEGCEIGTLRELAARHGWTPAHVDRIRALRQAIREASAP